MELDCSDVVHVPLQSEHALLHFVVPHLDHVVVTARDKHWLRLVEVDAANRTYSIFIRVRKRRVEGKEGYMTYHCDLRTYR